MTLRGGDAVDSYREPPPFDPTLDQPSDEYLERYWCGITYLDPESWRYYLPLFMDYAVRHLAACSSMVVEALLQSLRPPDREPPRLSALSAEQEQIIIDFLDLLAFDQTSVFQAAAMQVLEEYWVPNALYRKKDNQRTS